MMFRKRVLLYCCLLAACEVSETREDAIPEDLGTGTAGTSDSDRGFGLAGDPSSSDSVLTLVGEVGGGEGDTSLAGTAGSPDSDASDAGSAGSSDSDASDAGSAGTADDVPGTGGRGSEVDTLNPEGREQGVDVTEAGTAGVADVTEAAGTAGTAGTADVTETAGTAGTQLGTSVENEPSDSGGTGAESTDETLAAPSFLDVTVESGTRVLSWQDSTDGESGFEVEHRAGRTADFERLASVPANSTNVELPELEPGEHYFRVRALGRNGASEFSETYGLLIPGAIDPSRVPEVPSVSVFVSSPIIRFSWEAVDFLEDEGGCPTDDECGYRVYAQTDFETNYDVVSVAKDAVSVTVSDTLFETSYYISVFNHFGDSGPNYIATIQ